MNRKFKDIDSLTGLVHLAAPASMLVNISNRSPPAGADEDAGEPGSAQRDDLGHGLRHGGLANPERVLETILGDDRYGSGVGGINLDAGVADWSLSADATDLVRDWLRWEV